MARETNKRTESEGHRPRGPSPEVLKIDAPDGWEEAVRVGLHKSKPPNGWPKPEPKKRAPKKKKPRGK